MMQPTWANFTNIHTTHKTQKQKTHTTLSKKLAEDIDVSPKKASVQFSLSVVSDSLRPHELQPARPCCQKVGQKAFKITNF